MRFVLKRVPILVPFVGPSAHAEISDKCPSLLSRWDQNQSTWVFLTTSEALFKLFTFLAVSTAIAIAFYFAARKVRLIWIKYIPLVFAFATGSILALDLFVQDEPCAGFFWSQEMSGELYIIQSIMNLSLILIPLTLFVALWLKQRR